MKKKIAVGVIGVGHLGLLHAKMFNQIPTVEFVGVHDINQERIKKVSDELGVRSFFSLEDLLKNVSAVSIATPTSTHYQIAETALNYNVHLFIEKPITASIEEAHRLIRLAEDKGVKIQVGHIERFNPALMALEKYHLQPMFIESHRLSQFNMRGTDVAVVLDLMIHDIDIINSLVKSPWRNIQASGVAVVSDTIDIANARIQFENGCVANVTASRISQRKMRKMRLFQRDAYISIDFLEGSTEIFRLVGEDELDLNSVMMFGEISRGNARCKITYERPPVREINALKYELELFIDSIVNGKEPIVSATDGLRALEIAQQIVNEINQQNTSL